jgi:TRAP-type C4-dicarboxylate transport system permease small subunit
VSHAESTRPLPSGSLGRLESVITATEQAIASVALAAALLIALYTVLMRGLKVPTGEWVLDLPIELLGVTAIYGAGALLGRRGHMSVGFVVARFDPRVARVVALVIQVLMLAICVVLASRGFIAAGQSARAGLRQHELFDVPVAWLVWTGAIGFAGWTLHCALDLVEQVRALRLVGAPPAQVAESR